MSPLLVAAVMFLAREIKKMKTKQPNLPMMNNPTVSSYIEQGASHQMQELGRNTKSDLEVYIGFFQILNLFIGGASLIGVISYWQMMRVRYMMNVAT